MKYFSFYLTIVENEDLKYKNHSYISNIVNEFLVKVAPYQWRRSNVLSFSDENVIVLLLVVIVSVL